MKKQWLALATTALLVAGAMAAWAAESLTASSVSVRSFEFLGCSGDWPEEDHTPEITRMGSSGGITYLVRHPETCGADAARNPKATVRNGVLNLQYEPYSTSGAYAACPCEYWAKFTFAADGHAVRSATFRSDPARLKGSWPER